MKHLRCFFIHLYGGMKHVAQHATKFMIKVKELGNERAV